MLTIHAGAQNSPASKESAIITAMKNSENDWNKGDLIILLNNGKQKFNIS